MRINYSAYSDSELVKLLRGEKRESEQAFNELYRRYSSMVHAYCLRILGSQEEAEDVFQETFIKFYNNVKAEHENPNIPGFLIKISRNICLNIKRDREPTVPIDDSMTFPIEPNQVYEKTELLELITMALELLDFDYREPFVLREYDDMSYEQIAEICNISVVNAKSRVHRAKLKIKDILMPYLKDLV